MAAGKEIRGKIKSVENTKKITKAMEMVAASKMRKAQERMRAARPYAERIAGITANLAKANPEYRSPYMREIANKTGGNVGFIVITTDKGLCGGMNTNILRALTIKMRDVQERIESLGGEARWSTPEEFQKFLNDEIARWAPVARDAGVKLER